MYLDGGLEPVARFITTHLKQPIELASKSVGLKDYKTVLQEKLQAHGEVHIEYNIIHESGPDHNKRFVAEVKCNGQVLAIGEGRSKKNAEMEAARMAMEEKLK